MKDYYYIVNRLTNLDAQRTLNDHDIRKLKEGIAKLEKKVEKLEDISLHDSLWSSARNSMFEATNKKFDVTQPPVSDDRPSTDSSDRGETAIPTSENNKYWAISHISDILLAVQDTGMYDAVLWDDAKEAIEIAMPLLEQLLRDLREQGE